jgi:outer membrane protein OmpA-like peptidoglycan-associated protein
MKKVISICGTIALAMALVGCSTVGGIGRGAHEIPVARDYSELEKMPLGEAEMAVAKAHRVGSQHHAAYEYFTAKQYLDMAYEEKGEGDRPGLKDYTILAKQRADEAIAKGSGIRDKGELAMPRDAEACRAIYERLRARYNEICRMKAKVVSPVLLSHIEVALSRAEHELNEPNQYVDAARALVTVEPDIDAMWSQDVDGDGIVDLKDGAPWAAEDKDGYEDADGIPEPKPYPKLDAIHFDSAKANLTAGSVGYLRGVAQMLIDGYNEATLHVDGHTDEVHNDDYNADLSQRRAETVQACLTGNGAKASQLKVAWHGESKPVGDNSTQEGKAMNRRVELMLDSPDVKPMCECAKCK